MSIRRGPALKDEDLAALQSAIELELLPAPPNVGTEVLFATMPVNGAFRYEEVFQILPVPSEAPRPSVLIADHPFLLQFKYKSSQNSLVRAARRTAQARRLKLLLSVLLEGGVRSAGSFSRHHWVIPPFDPAPAPPLRSTWCQEMYTFESLGTVVASQVFADITSIESLPLIDPVEYYTRVGIQSGQTLSAPATLPDLLARFFCGSSDDQERFIRASFWFSHAHNVYPDSRSAAFTALISAVEALIPAEEKIGDCPMCRRALSKGAKRRLNEFLDQYAPTEPKFQASRVALYYQFRSQLTHGGALSHLDRDFFSFGLGGQRQEEQELLDEVWQLVRIVLVNWLYSRTPLLIPTKGRGLLAFGT